MPELASRRYERYVALGDSSTEGLDDPDGRGGYRGWANRLAERLADAQGNLLYANLAVRGRRTRQVRDEQLPRALAMRPDLVTVFCGTNDVVARRFDADAVAADLDAMLATLSRAGATLLTFTMPDLAAVMPMARRAAPRLAALNATIRELAARHGARCVDFEAHPVAADPRLWSDDRLHANAAGHARIAWALAHALGLPGADAGWIAPLPPAAPRRAARRVADELVWVRRHFAPWLWRHLCGRSSGDGRSAKRPELLPLAARPAA